MGPFGLMRRLSEEMDRIFASAWPDARSSETSGSWWPAVEISERDGKMIVCADLPGLDKNDVKVELTEGNLIIEGERKREHEENEKGLHRSERSYGSFYRSIPLPEGAKAESAQAQFKDGVLEITIPVAESQRRRTIPIEGVSGERKAVKTEGTSEPKYTSKTG